MTLLQPDSVPPEAPQKQWPSQETWPDHFHLHQNIREAIASLPTYFRTETHIAGIPATDIHNLNKVLGATIEDQFVRTLNSIRHVWDPDEKYSLYSFVRQPQTFPDVLFRRAGETPVMGIELKGWYLLSLEGEPSYRYKATPAASNPQDLLVLVPWVLSNVISGTPIAFDPLIEPSKWAAEYRNHWWMYLRESELDRGLQQPENVIPFPKKTKQINDVPAADTGDNFGRLSRAGIMDSYVADTKALELCGVRIDHWLAFFKAFQGGESAEKIRERIQKLAKRIERSRRQPNATVESVRVILAELEKMVGGRS